MTGKGYDPRKARGFIDVQALHMCASERARATRRHHPTTYGLRRTGHAVR
ncbi:MAG: hypothetical protein U0531_07295 [Dehalococcoidia bacterium]